MPGSILTGEIIMNNLMKNDIGEMVTDHGMTFPKNMTEDQFFAIGRKLSEFEQGMQWAIGDWYNAIKWSDKQAACEKVDLKFNTAKKYGYTCAQFQFGARAPLSYTHHYILSNSDLTEDQRVDLQKKAQAKKWTKRELTIERDKVLGTYAEKPDTSETVEAAVEAATKGVPEKYKKKVTAAVNGLGKRLQSEFQTAVDNTVSQKVKAERARLAEYDDELKAKDEALVGSFKRVQHILSLEEFKFIRALLHPDKHDSKDKAKYEKAFNIFQKLLDNVDPEARVRWANR